MKLLNYYYDQNLVHDLKVINMNMCVLLILGIFGLTPPQTGDSDSV